MHLTPGDTEKLLLAVAGMVARDRLEVAVDMVLESGDRLYRWLGEELHRSPLGTPRVSSAGTAPPG